MRYCNHGNRCTGSWRPRGFPVAANLYAAGGLAPQGYLRSVHLKNLRIAARRTQSGGNAGPRQEAQLHEAAGIFARQIDPFQDGRITPAKVNQRGQGRGCFQTLLADIVATQLHLSSSMRKSEMLVKSLAPWIAFFWTERFRLSSKW
jgi:hypothetical protein